MAIKIGQYMNVTGAPRPGSQPVPVNPPPVQPEKRNEIQPAPNLSQPATLEPQKAPNLSQPATLEFQPPPVLSEPTSPPLQTAPVLSSPSDPPRQQAPQLSTPMAVQTEVTQKAPPVTLRQPIPFQEPPPLSTPKPVAFQSPPELSSPAPIPPIEPAPKLSAPTAPPTQPAPPLPAPAVIPFQPAPELSAPAVIPFEPAPPLPTPAAIPFQPAPPLPTPAVIPFEPAPPLPAPAVIPFQPAPPLPTPAVIPFQPAPPITTPQPIPFEPAPPISLPQPIPFEPAPPISLPQPIPFQPAPPITPSTTASAQPSQVPDKVHPPTYTEERPYSDGFLDVHPGRQQMALGRQEKWSDKVDTQGGNLDLISSNVPAPFIGSFGFASLNPETLPNNLKLAAITEAQILAGRMGVQTTIDNAKNITTIVTKQQSTLIGMGMDFVNNAVFGSARGQSYHPIDGPTDQPQQPVEPYIVSDNRYYVGFEGGYEGDTPDYSDHTAPASTPQAMDLRYLNDPARDSPQTKKDRLGLMWLPAGKQLTQRPNPNAVTRDITRDNIVRPFWDPKANQLASTSAKEQRGFFDVNTDGSARENSLPTDDDAYMPLVFTDLRALQGKHYRSVYFRPFIKSLSEELSPQWNMQSFFGRVDAVATYKSTDRKINLAFKVVAFAPEDLETMYQKIGWLTSMVYPQYQSSVYYAGPVIRMRVGDIINAVGKEGNRGVPGVITSLNFNYDQSTWELLNGRRVPREIDVSMGFHVLHEYPIGLYHNLGQNESDLSFGGIRVGGDKQGSSETSYINIDRFRAIFGRDYLNDQRLSGEGGVGGGSGGGGTPADLTIYR